MAYAAMYNDRGRVRQFRRFAFCKQGRNYKHYGCTFQRFDGEPSITDPCGMLPHGWTVSIGLPFVLISYRSY